MMYPPFAFYRILDYFINACLEMQCYGLDILSPMHGLNLVTTGMVYLVLPHSNVEPKGTAHEAATHSTTGEGGVSTPPTAVQTLY